MTLTMTFNILKLFKEGTKRKKVVFIKIKLVLAPICWDNQICPVANEIRNQYVRCANKPER